MYLKLFFIIIGSLLAALLILEITYVYNLKDNMKKSSFVSFLTGLFLLYVISALSLMIIIPGVFNKLLILGSALNELKTKTEYQEQIEDEVKKISDRPIY